MDAPKAIPCIAGPLDDQVVARETGWRAGDHFHEGPHCYEVVWTPAGVLVGVWEPTALALLPVLLTVFGRRTRRNHFPQVE